MVMVDVHLAKRSMSHTDDLEEVIKQLRRTLLKKWYSSSPDVGSQRTTFRRPALPVVGAHRRSCWYHRTGVCSVLSKAAVSDLHRQGTRSGVGHHVIPRCLSFQVDTLGHATCQARSQVRLWPMLGSGLPAWRGVCMP
jgi:hypothetical protein